MRSKSKRRQKDAADIDSFSDRFAGMPHLAEEFKMRVGIMAEDAHASGADLEKARRFFAEKMSSEFVIRAMRSYPPESDETLSVFIWIAKSCYRHVNMQDIEKMATEDEHFDRLMEAVRNLYHTPHLANNILRIAAGANGDAEIQSTDSRTAKHIDAEAAALARTEHKQADNGNN